MWLFSKDSTIFGPQSHDPTPFPLIGWLALPVGFAVWYWFPASLNVVYEVGVLAILAVPLLLILGVILLVLILLFRLLIRLTKGVGGCLPYRPRVVTPQAPDPLKQLEKMMSLVDKLPIDEDEKGAVREELAKRSLDKLDSLLR